MNMNKVFLAGNMTRDPEARKIPNGKTVVKFGIAINRPWTDRQTGEKHEKVTFVDIEVWDKPAEFVAEFLRKGAPVLIEGFLDVDTWEDRQSGQKRSKMYVRAISVQALKQDGQQRTQAAPAQAAETKPVAQPESQPSAADEAFDVDDSIDDIPF